MAAVVEPYLERERIPGAVIALVVDGKPTLVGAFGLADVKSKAPMTAQTRFQVGSVTKTATATLVGVLAEEKRLSFEDEVSKHLPAGVVLPAALAEIRLSELMTHTSGLPREPINRENLPDTPSVMVPMTVEQLFDGLGRTKLERQRGEDWSYSNLGYGLLGALAAEAGEQPYPDLLQTKVLTPLGMKHSGVYVGDDAPENLASCYWPEDAELQARKPWRFGSACAFSGLVSTAGDLALLLAAQIDGGTDSLLEKETLAFLHRPLVEIEGSRGRSMAPGWFVDPMPGGGVALGHGGEVDGHSAVIAFFPGMRAGMVVLCNKGGKSAEGLAYPLMGAVLPRLSR